MITALLLLPPFTWGADLNSPVDANSIPLKMPTQHPHSHIPQEDDPLVPQELWDTLMAPVTQLDTESYKVFDEQLKKYMAMLPYQIFTLNAAFELILANTAPRLAQINPKCAHKESYHIPSKHAAHQKDTPPLKKLFTLLSIIELHNRIYAHENPGGRTRPHSARSIEKYKDFLRQFPSSLIVEQAIRPFAIIQQLAQHAKLKIGVVFVENAELSTIQHIMGLKHGYLLLPLAHGLTKQYWLFAKNIIEHIIVHNARMHFPSALIAEQIGTACTPRSLSLRKKSYLQEWARHLLTDLPNTLRYPDRTHARLDCPPSCPKTPKLLLLMQVLAYRNSIYEHPDRYTLLAFHHTHPTLPYPKFMSFLQQKGVSKDIIRNAFTKIPMAPTMTPYTILNITQEHWLQRTRSFYEYFTLSELFTILSNVLKRIQARITSPSRFKDLVIEHPPLIDGVTAQSWCIVVEGNACAPWFTTILDGEKKVCVAVPSTHIIDSIKSTDQADFTALSTFQAAQDVYTFYTQGGTSSIQLFFNNLQKKIDSPGTPEANHTATTIY